MSDQTKPGPKRTGRVVKTRTGQLQAIVVLVDGTTKRLAPFPKGTSLAMAKDKALAWQQRVDREGLRSPPRPVAAGDARETVSQWFDRWAKQREAEGIASVRDDRGRYHGHIAPVIGTKAIADITHDDIDAVVDALNEKVNADTLAWKTATNVWMLLRKMMKDAVRKKGFRALEANPCDRSEPPERGEDKAFTYLQPVEFLRLISDETVPLLWRRMVVFSCYLGLRSSELAALEWRDIDIAMGIVTVRRSMKRNKKDQTKAPKAGKAKRIPLPLALRPLVMALWRPGISGRVFPYRKIAGRAEKLRDFMKRAGLERPELYETTDLEGAMRWHDLRATTATWHAIDGADTKAIKVLMRHGTEKMSEKYIHEAALYGKSRDERIAVFGEVFPSLPEALLVRAPDRDSDHLDENLSDSGAGHGSRTRDLELGKLALYQLS
jgi:integrase